MECGRVMQRCEEVDRDVSIIEGVDEDAAGRCWTAEQVPIDSIRVNLGPISPRLYLLSMVFWMHVNRPSKKVNRPSEPIGFMAE